MTLIIGDCHGRYNDYKKITESTDCSIQLGDFGFKYDILKDIDSVQHRIFGGNHEYYPELFKIPHNLGHFGLRKLDSLSFYFIRGGHSIDKTQRILGFDYFEEEELNFEQAAECINDFAYTKPDIVLSHECPMSVERELFKDRSFVRSWGYPDNWNSYTSKILQYCLMNHRPKLYLFGHFHSFRDQVINGTRFICLPELATCEVSISNSQVEVSNIFVPNSSSDYK